IAIAAALFASSAVIALADDTDFDTETSETRELSEAQLLKAKLLADYSVDGDADQEAVDEIVDLRTGDTVIGWGAMFKLLQLEKATDMTLAQLVEVKQTSGFGWMFREYEVDKKDGNTPKNLGQLKKQNRGPKGSQGKKP
ncbi:MAG: hypothetical protein ACC683_13670, partial [Acidimicrobiia bacterium]